MSKITLAPNASGSGTLTVAAPNTNTDRTLTLPDATGTAIINKGSEIFNIDTGGNLGMGTSSPVGAGLTLNLQGSTSSSYSSIVAGSPSNANFVSFYSGQTVDPNPSIVYNNSLRIGSATSPNTSGYVERMRIDSSGNVGIGTTAPGAKLDVTNNQAALSYLIDTNNTTNGGSSIWRMITRNIANTGTTSVEFYKPTGSGFSLLNNDTNGSNFTAFNVGASERMRIDSSGGLILAGSTAQKATGTTWSNPSDQRLKTNIMDYPKGINELMQVRVREWEYNGKGGTTAGMAGLGVIADEVMTVLPNTVDTYDAKLDEADEETTDIKKFDATEITWLLVKAVQEQQAIITALEARIAALEAK
jgi:hypothetical protein